MIDENKIIRITYSKFDRMQRIIKNKTATNLYKDKRGNIYKFLSYDYYSKTITMEIVN